MVQLEELLAIRHCVFIMGPPGAGKTQCWKTLAQARKLRNNPTKVSARASCVIYVYSKPNGSRSPTTHPCVHSLTPRRWWT